jgi:hypothetical protein
MRFSQSFSMSPGDTFDGGKKNLDSAFFYTSSG